MKKRLLLQALSAIAEIDRPVDIGRTKTSRESDQLIDDFSIVLAAFVTAWLLKGFFTQAEQQQLTQGFHLHAERQYLLGQAYADKATDAPKPLTRKDLDAIEELAKKAQQDFVQSLATTPLKLGPGAESKIEQALRNVAGQTSSDLGVRALNKGTTSHARLVIFATRRDSRVCPICEDHDGDVYEVDPLTGIIKNGPLIPDDTHPNCRCRYLVFASGAEE